MKNYLLLLGSLWLLCNTCAAQANNDSLYTGLYQVNFLKDRKFNIYLDGDKLMLEIVGQGRTDLIPAGVHRFKVNHVKPDAFVMFVPGENNSFTALQWMQQAKDQEWNRVAGNDTGYAGKYKAKGNTYLEYTIAVEEDHLTGRLGNESSIKLYKFSHDYFGLKDGDYSTGYRFIRDANGSIEKMIVDQHGVLECRRIAAPPVTITSAKHNFNDRTHFTHADTLMGQLGPMRTCYDVLFYHLDLTVLPAARSIKGSNSIRFKAVNDFDKLQVDLFANMSINKILYHNRELTWQREAEAVFIQLGNSIAKNSIDEIKIFYEGVPQLLDLEKAQSGWIWYQDNNQTPWIETVSQGSGASLWWPCKDHLSDKPDSMRLTITVPNGLTEISNGKLLSTTAVGDDQTCFDWYVSYPINTYNASIYIGDYVHTADASANYYCLKENLETATAFFTNVGPVLQVYEKSFGAYPFQKDGVTIVEALYPMEHQGAVSMGSIYSPPGSKQFDSAGLLNTLWHEIAHEWWGNSVTCKDYADFWIHESFATYAELLARKHLRNDTYAKELANTHPGNKEPIIGFYDVNDFHMGDVYSKGALMLLTLQQVINNDSAWFNMLTGMQEKFRYQSISTEDVIDYVNAFFKADYRYYFYQYLKYATIPTLQLKFNQSGKDLIISYRWQADVNNFKMPVRARFSGNKTEWVYPANEWKEMLLTNTTAKDVDIEKNDLYNTVVISKDRVR